MRVVGNFLWYWEVLWKRGTLMYARSWHRGPRFHGYDAIITSIKNMAMNRREIFRHTISFLFVFILLVCKPTTICLMFFVRKGSCHDLSTHFWQYFFWICGGIFKYDCQKWIVSPGAVVLRVLRVHMSPQTLPIKEVVPSFSKYFALIHTTQDF